MLATRTNTISSKQVSTLVQWYMQLLPKLSFCISYLLVGLISGLYLTLILLTYLKTDGEHKLTVVKAIKAVKGYLLLHQEIEELVPVSSYVSKILFIFLC